MTITGVQLGSGCSNTSNNCTNQGGCPSGATADFCIKRHDTKPDFRVSVTDCDGPLDLTEEGLVLEVNMWAKGKLKAAITASDTSFTLADNIGFDQVMVGDVIVFDRIRMPESMLVTGFDEENYLIYVQRGYNNTTASSWKKGSALKIFRILNATGSITSTYDDIVQEDGSTAEDQLIDTSLVYSWNSYDTCLPGCFYLEFKLLKILVLTEEEVAISYTPDDFGCGESASIEWVRRFPETAEGFLISIIDTPTSETLS